ADNSAKVTALIAICAGSVSGSICRRRIRTLVSTIPIAGISPVIWAARLAIGHCVQVGPEQRRIDHRRIPRHRSEVGSADEAAPPTERNQLADLMTVAGHRERPPVFDGVHDLFRPVAQVALSDLGLHKPTIPAYSTV